MNRGNVLRVLSRLGVGQPALQLYDSAFGLPTGHDQFEIDVESGSPPENDGLVMFPYAHQAENHAFKYGILAQAFKTRGYKPLFVLPGSCLPMSCARRDRTDGSAGSELREYATKQILREFGHDWVRLTDHLPDDRDYRDLPVEGMRTARYGGINLNDFAEASTRKVVKKYHIESERDREIHRQFLRSGVLLVDAYQDLVDQYSPTCLIAHDDKYNQGGIPLAVADMNGVHAYSSTFGWMNESLVLGNVADRNSFPHYEERRVVNEFLDRPLDPEQRKRADEIMTDRMAGKAETRARYAARTSNSVETTDDITTIGLFTNLIWDANLEVTNCPYPNVFDWIRDTISELGDAAGVELIIKPHPAENSRGTNESVRGWIHDTYPDLPDNITVLRADTDINTYRMIPDIDVAVVYNSTVGFEMVYAGVPAITAGETHYRDLDISRDPTTTDEYLNMLRNSSSIGQSKRRQRRARRYIYFLLEGKHLRFPYIHTTDTRSYEFRPVSDEDIESSDVFDHIVEKCVNGQPVLEPELDWLLASPSEPV